MLRIARLGTNLLVVLIGAALISACASDDTYLPALLADPMADYSHPALEVETRVESPKGDTPFAGTNEPSVFTGFALEGDPDAVVDDVLAAAETAGWVILSEEPVVGSDGFKSWSAEKEIAEGVAGLDINLRPPDSEERIDLSIRLSFREEYE